MKASLTALNGRLRFEVEAENHKKLWDQIAEIDEIFNATTKCGLCGKDNLKFRVRPTDKGKYYEIVCQDCDARFDYGQHQDTPTLFPKHRNDEKGYRGWYHYTGSGQGQPHAPTPQHAPAQTRSAPRSAPAPRNQAAQQMPPQHWGNDGVDDSDVPF